MPNRPNILFLMADQMQGRTLEPEHPCRAPNLDRLAARGVRFRRAYTPNAVCSPARASLMTGLLPHNHGVLEVVHCVDPDQCRLREDKPHWAQRLQAVGYRTGYFGNWHLERENRLHAFGWQVDGNRHSEAYRRRQREMGTDAEEPYALARYNQGPDGYPDTLHYAVVDSPPDRRPAAVACSLARDFLADALLQAQPWCCFVSVVEPHDPFVCGRAAFEQYDVDRLPLPPNARDPMTDRPGIYRKAARLWKDRTDRERREAAACYYAAITEVDDLFGRLIDQVQTASRLDETVVVFTADHGELLGAHGLYCKNFSAFEEVYHIPMVLAGPGVAAGVVTDARVGLHDLAPTLLDLTEAGTLGAPDSRSFAAALRDPAGRAGDFTAGFAEYHGTRYRLTQRVVWEGPWKYVFNGFDNDELYRLDEDPFEMRNLAVDAASAPVLRRMAARMWRVMHDTGDRALLGSHYPILRVAPFGPGIADEDGRASV